MTLYPSIPGQTIPSTFGHYEIALTNEYAGGKWIVQQLIIYDNNLNAAYLSNRETQGYWGGHVDFRAADFYVYDREAPVVTGVEDGGAYNTDVYPAFNEGTAKLNNRAFESGSAVTEEGSYYLFVKDRAGNSTSVGFEIIKTAPVVTGVEHNSIGGDV
ncbi:MAG TPA: hypothetical protein VK947_12690, partial [Planococcus sp. (in: firmicutes)]|nr:hypothetical protein [Planococcus sp. (in: firmicutes)]